ncbi:MAG TPA: hypothetical protein VJ860_17260 [Polyangia bacterium]|jgi:hypothetical protein|nr:hypothetical protein [Polyangia bacterium]
MRYLLTIAMFGVLGTSLSGCEKSDAAATKLCKDYSAAVCERYLTCQAAAESAALAAQPPVDIDTIDTVPFTCPSGTIKRPTWFPAEIGCSKDLSDCTAKLEALECGHVAETRCTSGATYHADKAEACVTGWQSLSCDNVQKASITTDTDPNDPKKVAPHQPVECYLICIPPLTDAGLPY